LIAVLEYVDLSAAPTTLISRSHVIIFYLLLTSFWVGQVRATTFQIGMALAALADLWVCQPNKCFFLLSVQTKSYIGHVFFYRYTA